MVVKILRNVKFYSKMVCYYKKAGNHKDNTWIDAMKNSKTTKSRSSKSLANQSYDIF